ncbi:hypothetical protein EYC84_006986 [Monilinia fructicola]|uniref:C3H1-type domain-containing protein n=1 Tax=Monilinia fructicola TaxID=38448 RepID=A0A5M9K551_MONFR|nr:hypothetical protein EYC84_006986 [Monilinia fructicola]
MAGQPNWRKDDAGRGWREGGRERGSWRGSGRGSRGNTSGSQGNWRSGFSVARGRGCVESDRAYRSGRKSNSLCSEFQASGSCTGDSRCKYSHQLHEHSDVHTLSEQHLERTPETEEQIEIRNEFRRKYSSWKRLIKSRPRPNDIRTVEILWQGALEILDGEDRDSKQMVAGDLENDEFHGREHIRVLLEMTTYTYDAAIFVELVRPFLSVITHQALLDCLSIDTCVENLYNFISGSNGSRAMPFFQRLVANLLEMSDFADAIAKENIERTMIAMSTCLKELARRERRVLFHDDFPDIITSLEKSVGVVGVDRSSAAFSIIPSRTQELRGMIARVHGQLYREDQPPVWGASTTVMKSAYPREIIMPSKRHDNDEMDITDIRILPTEDELRSEAVEFLPSTDPDQPHFLVDSAARLLDTHFRLLRHDIFGELKSALGGLILTIEAQPSVLEDPSLNLKGIRAHSYVNAHVADITFDQRRGCEAQLSFSHPTKLAKKFPEER